MATGSPIEQLRAWLRRFEESPYKGAILATIVIHLLNLADAVFTMHWIENGEAYEFNPLMNFAFELGSYGFLFTKIAIVLICLSIFWWKIKHRLARIGAYVLMVVYAIVVSLHLTYFLKPDLHVGKWLSNVPIPIEQVED